MGSLLADNIISIIFGITTVISSAVAIYYHRLEHRQRVEKVLDEGRLAGLFLSREAMIKYLLQMYDEAEAGGCHLGAMCALYGFHPGRSPANPQSCREGS